MTTQMTDTCTLEVFETLYTFVEEMSPSYEMCLDFCESQGIEVSQDVDTVITDLLWNKEND
jgi:hypothetical protein